MNAIILKGAALRQPPLPQSGPRAKTIAHPCPRVFSYPVNFLNLYDYAVHQKLLVLHDYCLTENTVTVVSVNHENNLYMAVFL
jgi:hypothetical protein